MRKRDVDKEALVKQKAIELLVRDGFEGFSINKLAKACDISVATLYIYYKDRDDLIVRIALEEAKMMSSTVLRDFTPDLSFEEGLRLQWKNRAAHVLQNPDLSLFFEKLRNSTYRELVFDSIVGDFKEVMGKFITNAIKRGEIDPMPLEVYWSVAFAPLYNLLRFHQEGRSIGGKPFVFSETILWQTFDLVLKAFKK